MPGDREGRLGLPPGGGSSDRSGPHTPSSRPGTARSVSSISETTRAPRNSGAVPGLDKAEQRHHEEQQRRRAEELKPLAQFAAAKRVYTDLSLEIQEEVGRSWRPGVRQGCGARRTAQMGVLGYRRTAQIPGTSPRVVLRDPADADNLPEGVWATRG
ncbi:MAG: hypothetical protein AB2556_21040, partial [Candidatus Thiodiazotropha sp.]